MEGLGVTPGDMQDLTHWICNPVHGRPAIAAGDEDGRAARHGQLVLLPKAVRLRFAARL